MTPKQMRRAAKLMEQHAALVRNRLLDSPQEPWMREVFDETDELQSLAKLLRAHCLSCEQRSLKHDRRHQQHQTFEQWVTAKLTGILEIQAEIVQSNISGAKFMASIDQALQDLLDSEGKEKTAVATLAGIVTAQQGTITNLQETITNLSKDDNRLTDAQRTTLDLAVGESKANTADVQAILNGLAKPPIADPIEPAAGAATEVPA